MQHSEIPVSTETGLAGMPSVRRVGIRLQVLTEPKHRIPVKKFEAAAAAKET
jgi:hypothetical protein